MVHADYDNDGNPDLYLGTGAPEIWNLMPNMLFLNQGGKSFADVTMASGLGHLQKGHAIAFADFDQDGDQDIFGGNPLRQHIGIGSATRITSVEVTWPTTGETQVFHDLRGEQVLEITEGISAVTERPLIPFSTTAAL